MTESKVPYNTAEHKCPNCGALLAQRSAEGVVYVGSVPLMAQVEYCPKCKSISLTQFASSGNLEFGDQALEEVAKTLGLINGNGGFGTLIVKFQKGRARWVGLGETLRDCQ